MNEAAFMMFLQSVKARMKAKDPDATVECAVGPQGWRMLIKARLSSHDSWGDPRRMTCLTAPSSVELMETVNTWVEAYKYPERKEEPRWDSVIVDDPLERVESVRIDKTRKWFALDYTDLNKVYNTNPRNYAKGKK